MESNLLEASDITEYLVKAEITREKFKSDDGEVVDYNRFLVTLANGEAIPFKFTRDGKLAMKYALREVGQ